MTDRIPFSFREKVVGEADRMRERARRSETLTANPSPVGEGRTLNHLIGRKRAGDVRIDLDLHGRMIDLEALGEIAA